ncbi:lytic polysaccharide monooxygenase [Zopfia rhizophila CBS 207.26]|uniref:lytic cellulose monooxygenase (C4-dehydrogenating) n=1 Tax=Zopfia rhizophila CBS 207.26 TaxID=1314779 RepID=A0A6A6DWC9_9PEZI|nr:lytic polysaccharide monooxygenase [Zopfia rhizophila CBS 207.26]
MKSCALIAYLSLLRAVSAQDVAGDPWWSEPEHAKGFPPQYAKRVPFFDLHSPNMVCGREAEKSAAKTETATVVAGDEVGFRIADIVPGDLIFHDGPGQIYMSRAPNDDLEHYDGRGDWFKIAYVAAKNDTTWQLKWTTGMNFTIPKTTPPGKYLLRIEHLQPSYLFNMSQWYINCAHVNIVGSGGGTPTGFARFPEAYDIEDPGIRITEAQDKKTNLLSYVPPGPKVWTG